MKDHIPESESDAHKAFSPPVVKTLAVFGTGSGVGKSLIVAGLCRLLKDRGIDVSPFKAQNMALNSFITIEGAEIGRAQAFQAEAARIHPTVLMNPVLLKASGEAGSQVIFMGKVFKTLKAQEYYQIKDKAWEVAKEAFDRLALRHQVLILEGAGSPAEINLMEKDIVNMPMAKYANAPVILVGDIDKGGVFASLYGTVKLLGEDARFIKGFIINKFRGDLEILRPGLKMLEDLTGVPVLGVLPYVQELRLPEEDGLALSSPLGRQFYPLDKEIKVVVVRLPYVSNFTDLDPLRYEPDVDLIFSNSASEILNSDMIVIPGTKNTVKDLEFLRKTGLKEAIIQAFKAKRLIMGICGGYQLLGRVIKDPLGVESFNLQEEGLGLLDIETIFEPVKITTQSQATVDTGYLSSRSSGGYFSFLGDLRDVTLHGYEIHMGISKGDMGLFKIKRLAEAWNSNEFETLDGTINQNCLGTYLHGIFENDVFRRALMDEIRIRKGLRPLGLQISYHQLKDQAIDTWATILEQHLDITAIMGLLGL